MSGGPPATGHYLFPTRGAAVIWWNNISGAEDGTTIWAEGLYWVAFKGATAVADMLGVLPGGTVRAEHFKANLIPGVTTMHTAINAALTYAGHVELDGTYAISDNIALSNTYLSAVGQRQATILGLAATSIDTPLVTVTRQGGIEKVGIFYEDAALTFTEGKGERVCIALADGDGNVASKGAFIDKVIVGNCGTGIFSETGSFNISVPNLDILGYTFRAWDAPVGTGNRLGQIYIEGFAASDDHADHIADAAINIEPQAGKSNSGTAGDWGQINIHISKVGSALLKIESLTGLTIGALHMESCVLAATATGAIDLHKTNLKIGSWQPLAIGLNDMTNPALLYLRDGKAPGNDAGSASFAESSSVSIGNCSFRALNNPSDIIEGYTPEGLEALSSFLYAKRAPGATGRYDLTFENEPTWVIYPGEDTATERAMTKAFWAGIDPAINLTRIGPQIDNLVLNGGFDNWTSASVSSTGGIEAQGPTNWFAHGVGSATIRMTRVDEPLGSETPYHMRFENLATSGAACYVVQRMGEAGTLSGQTCVLSFEAYAATAGQALEDILCSLANAAGTPTATFARVVLGNNARAAFTTTWKRFEFEFVFPTITSLGAGATYDLTFRISGTAGTRESDIHIRKIGLWRASSARPWRRRFLAA